VVTNKEQYIYNCYLETSRKINNLPFRYRKDFEDFDKKEEFIYVNKLSNFFGKFESINVKDFFEAPYFVYNEKYFDLKFFTSQKAIKAYTIYQTKFLVDNPDNDKTIEKIKESFIFLYKFCKEKNITFDNYIDFVQTDNKLNQFFIHLKNRDIILYVLFVFPNFDKTLKNLDNELKELMFGDTLNNINFFRTKYYSSSRAKKMCIEAYNTLNSKLTSKN